MTGQLTLFNDDNDFDDDYIDAELFSKRMSRD